MIRESGPWKRRLANDADLLARWSAKTSVTERRSFIIEEKVFFAAYVMRKLFEAGKLSSCANGWMIQANRYARRPEVSLTPLNWHRFEDVFDMSQAVGESIGARKLLDIIIHSSLFIECLYGNDDCRVLGFFVTSDRNNDNMWLIHLDNYIALMRRVSEDYPSVMRYAANREAGEIFIWRGNKEPPRIIEEKFDRILKNNNKNDL